MEVNYYVISLPVKSKAPFSPGPSVTATAVSWSAEISASSSAASIQTNFAAQKCYEKFGFEIYHTRKNYYDKPLEDALLMRKENSVSKSFAKPCP